MLSGLRHAACACGSPSKAREVSAAYTPKGSAFLSINAQPRPGAPCWRLQGGRPRREAAGRGRLLVGRAVDPDLLADPDVPLAKLQEMLDDAIDREDYSAAAQIRDTLQKRRFDNRHAVEEVNDRFYRAFQAGSLKEMAAVWGTGEHVQCIHPGSGCIAGRQEVLEGWKAIFASGRLKIKIEDVRTFATDDHAYVTCVERMEGSDSRGRVMATNVFEKQHNQWKMVLHHGSAIMRGM